MITNSRQNTRFRWKDAQKLEKFANGIDDNSNITFPGNIVVNSADNIVDKDGNPIAGGGEKEVIELNSTYSSMNYGGFNSRADYNKVYANPQKYIGHFKRDQYNYDTWVNFNLQTRGNSSLLVGYAIGSCNAVSVVAYCALTVILYYSYNQSELYTFTTPSITFIEDYRVYKGIVNEIADTNGKKYELIFISNDELDTVNVISRFFNRPERYMNITLYEFYDETAPSRNIYTSVQYDITNNTLYARKLSDNTVIQIPIPANEYFDTVKTIHGVETN